MFPEPLRNISSKLANGTTSLSKSLFKLSKTGIWVAASSFTILIMPILLEQERSTIEEQQNLQQRELLLGPSAASSHSSSLPGGMPFGLTPSK